MSFRPDGQATLGDSVVDVDPALAEALKHPEPSSALRRAFTLPPFSVLDTRSGEWQTRRQQWLALGIKSELGRGGDGTARTFAQDIMRGEVEVGGSALTLESLSGRVPDYYDQWEAAKKAQDRDIPRDEFERDILQINGTSLSATGTSIFDPVLCELIYRWFAPPGGSVLDPFAGGSVRGVVAAVHGLRYEGVDLSERQIVANREQWEAIAPHLSKEDRDRAVWPTWTPGDSRDRIGSLTISNADLVFTCPPYYDLEVYSDDPRDLSNEASYAGFLEGYQDVIFRAVGKLANHRFAVFVVGDVRDKQGFYHGLVRDTVDALEAAGAAYYNHAILVNSVGSLPVRAARQFKTMRKLGKTHQDVVIAYKGDPKHIRNHFPEETS